MPSIHTMSSSMLLVLLCLMQPSEGVLSFALLRQQQQQRCFDVITTTAKRTTIKGQRSSSILFKKTFRGGAFSDDNNHVATATFSSSSSPTTPSISTSLAASGGGDDEESLHEQQHAPPSGGGDSSTSTVSSTASKNNKSNIKLGGPPPGLLRRTFKQFPWHRLPDWLTYMRCMAIPSLIYFFYLPTVQGEYRAVTSSILFASASITDWFDGYLARRWEITSSFGAFLDPVADKLMVSTALILLTGKYGRIMAIPTSIILAREIAVSALREWMAQKGLRDSVKVGFQGKVKTAATMFALTILLLVSSKENSILYLPGMAMLYFSAFITITSGSVYFRAAAPVLLGKDDE